MLKFVKAVKSRSFSELTHLNLSSNKIHDFAFECFIAALEKGVLPNLEILNLKNNPIIESKASKHRIKKSRPKINCFILEED